MAEECLSHFSHPIPGHELVRRHYIGSSFRCDMCRSDLSGGAAAGAYVCRAAGCDFAIHEACAAHLRTLPSPAHHPHPLTLVLLGLDGGARAARCCDVCASCGRGGAWFYRCEPCDVDLHVSCAAGVVGGGGNLDSVGVGARGAGAGAAVNRNREELR